MKTKTKDYIDLLAKQLRPEARDLEQRQIRRMEGYAAQWFKNIDDKINRSVGESFNALKVAQAVQNENRLISNRLESFAKNINGLLVRVDNIEQRMATFNPELRARLVAIEDRMSSSNGSVLADPRKASAFFEDIKKRLSKLESIAAQEAAKKSKRKKSTTSRKAR